MVELVDTLDLVNVICNMRQRTDILEREQEIRKWID